MMTPPNRPPALAREPLTPTRRSWQERALAWAGCGLLLLLLALLGALAFLASWGVQR